jgi:hypothetical protein
LTQRPSLVSVGGVAAGALAREHGGGRLHQVASDRPLPACARKPDAQNCTVLSTGRDLASSRIRRTRGLLRLRR